jgi:hypothetical protein
VPKTNARQSCQFNPFFCSIDVQQNKKLSPNIEKIFATLKKSAQTDFKIRPCLIDEANEFAP